MMRKKFNVPDEYLVTVIDRSTIDVEIPAASTTLPDYHPQPKKVRMKRLPDGGVDIEGASPHPLQDVPKILEHIRDQLVNWCV